MSLKIEYEDTLVKVAGMLGGEPYIKVARAILNNEDTTDEEIASATGLKINIVRRILYDLFGRSLITGIRVREPKRGWYVYRWRVQRDQVDAFVNSLKRKTLNRLKVRLEFEQSHQFYRCSDKSHRRLTFEEAVENLFKCPLCGNPVELVSNEELIKALKWKIKELEKDIKRSDRVESVKEK